MGLQPLETPCSPNPDEPQASRQPWVCSSELPVKISTPAANSTTGEGTGIPALPGEDLGFSLFLLHLCATGMRDTRQGPILAVTCATTALEGSSPALEGLGRSVPAPEGPQGCPDPWTGTSCPPASGHSHRVQLGAHRTVSSPGGNRIPRNCSWSHHGTFHGLVSTLENPTAPK